MSTVGANTQAPCLPGRVSRVGKSHRAAKRRELVNKEDIRREETMKARWIANVRKCLEEGGATDLFSVNFFSAPTTSTQMLTFNL